MVHICFVSDTILSYFGSSNISGTGGAERQQRYIAIELAKRGHTVSIATLKDSLNTTDTIDGIELHPIIPDLRGVVNAPYKAFTTFRGLARIDADVYYVRGNDFLCMVTATFAAFTQAQFVFSVANDSNVDPELLGSHWLSRIPYTRAIRAADHVVAQTEHQRMLLDVEYDITASVIPNGIKVPSDLSIVPHDQREYVLWVGAIDPIQKKPERFIELASHLPTINFRMIGPPDNDHPEYYNAIQRKADRIDNLEFFGYVAPEEIHEHYRHAIALVNTSDYEGFPNVFLESWVHATPVVTLHFTIDELFRDNSIGIHAGSMKSLISAVEQLSSDESLRRRLGTRGRDRVIGNYSLEETVDQYEDLFESLHNRSHS